MGLKIEEVRQQIQGYNNRGGVTEEPAEATAESAPSDSGQMTKAEIWEKLTVTPKSGVRSKKIQVLVDETLFRKVQAASKDKGTTASTLIYLLLQEMFGDYEAK